MWGEEIAAVCGVRPASGGRGSQPRAYPGPWCEKCRGTPRAAEGGLRARARVHRLPAASDPHDGRVRGRQRGRGPDVHRRGVRGRARTSRGCRSSAGRGSCSTRCCRRSGWSALGVHRQRRQVPPARQPRPPPGGDRVLPCRSCARQVELIEPRVICTLGNFSTKLLRGDPTGISRLHGQDEVRTIGRPHDAAAAAVFHPAAALYTPSIAADAARRLRPDPGAARRAAPRPARPGRGSRTGRARPPVSP